VAGSVRHLRTRGAPARLLLDSIFPDDPVRLLWFQGRPAQPLARGSVTLDGSGGVLRFDEQLRAAWVHLDLQGRELLSLAPAADGGWWLGTGTGEILKTGASGTLLDFARDSGGHSTVAARVGIQFPALAPDPAGRGVWVTRSPDRFGFGWAPRGLAPPILLLTETGAVVDSLGRAVVPAHALLTDLANAGRAVASGDTVWYAPFIRDQVVALGPRGDTLWVASRGLAMAESEPRFEIRQGKPVIDYLPINLGVALGPDGRLYVLSTRDSSALQTRLDVFDRATGVLVRSAELETPTPTLAADHDGRVYRLDPVRLLTGMAARERVGFPEFDLELLGGGRVSSPGIRGQVTLVNLWASWCAPCRTEMPALDSLRRGIRDRDFGFLAIDEDIDTADGRKFIAEMGFDFPVLFGRGHMKDRYHYPGLPVTAVLDREGRVAGQWFGFSGPDQIGAIRAVIASELNSRPAGRP
jgi:thiol-disulfide isomerase/thioredoxin